VCALSLEIFFNAAMALVLSKSPETETGDVGGSQPSHIPLNIQINSVKSNTKT
jgi:hypothetical protein